MSLDRTNAGDPDRTLALLWRDSSTISRRGPRQGLTVDRVLDAAMELADRDGLAKVSMRRIAGALGVAAMTVYTYVPAKAELLDLMLDAAYTAMDRTDTSGHSWRERVRAVAEENRELYVAHPWAATVSIHRPSLGPGQMVKYEHELHAFDDLGLADVERDAALAHLLSFVRAHARAVNDATAAERESAISDQQWWEANEVILQRVFDPSTYPLAVRVGTAAGTANDSAWNADSAWNFGLDRTIDGLAALVDRDAPA